MVLSKDGNQERTGGSEKSGTWKVKAMGTADVASYADSGTLYTIDSDAATAITIKPGTPGTKYKFVVIDAGAVDTVITLDGAYGYGGVRQTATDVDMLPAVAETTITFNADSVATVIGDWVSLECITPTVWLIDGYTVTAATIVFA